MEKNGLSPSLGYSTSSPRSTRIQSRISSRVKCIPQCVLNRGELKSRLSTNHMDETTRSKGNRSCITGFKIALHCNEININDGMRPRNCEVSLPPSSQTWGYGTYKRIRRNIMWDRLTILPPRQILPIEKDSREGVANGSKRKGTLFEAGY